MNITKLSVNRPTLVVVIFTVLLFLGFAGYKSLKYELMPPMTAPAFMVNVEYPGASPSEVENDVTKKMEDILSSVENIDHIQSTSYEGMASIGIEMKMSANIDNAVQDAQRRINAARSTLPKGVLDPVVSKIALSDFPIMKIGATSNMQSGEFYDLLKHTIQPELSRIKGVADVSLIGGNEREIREKISSTQMPANVSVHYAGDMEMQGDAFGTLGFALLTAIFLVYLIMVALYESYMYPFVVLFTIPLAVIGAILGLALAKQTLNIFSMVGIIMLVGLVAKNAILVVDFTNQLKKQGKKTKEALLEATKIRLRPVLMTTIAMIIGLLPIALASGAASEWKNGIAWVLIGGLTSSMFLTLIMVPVVFLTMEKMKDRLSHLYSKFTQRKVENTL